MGSTVSISRPRIKKADYENLKKNIDKEYFYIFYLNNCNDYVCKEFEINLSTLYKLLKDFEIKLTAEQLKHKNKIASEQKCLELFGKRSSFAVEATKAKIKETNFNKYGVVNPFAAEEVKNKIKQTNVDRYGVEYTSQSPEVKQKIKAACLKKYGVDNYAKTAECRQKMEATLLNRYGRVDIGQFGTPEHKTALINKYGTDCISTLDEIKEKAKQTSLSKYGVTHYSKTTEFHQRLHKRYSYGDQYFDSLPEVAIWVYCLDNNIKIKRTPCSFTYVFADKEYSYFPDFEIAGKLVEIKGDHFFKQDGTMQNPFDPSQDALYEAKHQCGLQHGVEFWTKTIYKPYVRYLIDNYNVVESVIKKNKED